MSLNYDRNSDSANTGKYACVLKRVEPKSAILEIGCHTGYFSQVLKNQGHHVLGLEIDSEAATLARASGIEVLCYDIEKKEQIDSIAKKFDTVLLMDVLEHLKDPEGVLKNLHTVISKNGKIVLTAPNVAYWAVRKNLLLGRWDYADAGILDRTHLRFYTRKTWVDLLVQSGFIVTHLEVADAMIPLESRLKKIWKSDLWLAPLSRWLVKRFPTVFAISFLIEAVPTPRQNPAFS